MKKAILICCLLLIAGSFFAQEMYNLADFNEKREHLFSPTKKKIFFHFALKSGEMTLELSNSEQLDSMPPLDVLLPRVDSAIRFIYDSIDRNSSYFIKYDKYRSDTYVSAHNNFPMPGLWFVNGQQIKPSSDTIVIELYAKRHNALAFSFSYPYVLLFSGFTETNLSEILQNNPNLPGLVDSLRKDLSNPAYKKNWRYYSHFEGYYSVSENRLSYPRNPKDLGTRRTIAFNIQNEIGLQFLRGYWMPSAAAGISVLSEVGSGKIDHSERLYMLLWEPYFSFTTGMTNKTLLTHNDFITVKYRENVQVEQYPSNYNNPDMRLSFSFGYLVRRKGTSFNPTTFKLGMPGIYFKSLMLEPEFVFNRFFRDFSPSLKLTMLFQ